MHRKSRRKDTAMSSKSVTYQKVGARRQIPLKQEQVVIGHHHQLLTTRTAILLHWNQTRATSFHHRFLTKVQLQELEKVCGLLVGSRRNQESDYLPFSILVSWARVFIKGASTCATQDGQPRKQRKEGINWIVPHCGHFFREEMNCSREGFLPSRLHTQPYVRFWAAAIPSP